MKKYGPDDLDVYHTTFKPLEWNFLESHKAVCYIKVIVDLKTDKVIGIHYLGPNAGEIIQGYSVALKCGVTRELLFETVGLHPTCSENIVKLHMTKRNDPNAKTTGC